MSLTFTVPHALHRERTGAIQLSEVISALSLALDLAEGQPEGHAVRTCRIGMRLADEISLGPVERGALFYALLLKDLGATANASRLAALFGADERLVRREWLATDGSRLSQVFRHAARSAAPGRGVADRALRVFGISARGRGEARHLIAARAEQAGRVSREMGFADATADAIMATDERWDGRGDPQSLEGEAIPLLSRVIAVAQTLDRCRSVDGHEAAYDNLWSRRGREFDPMLVDASFAFRTDTAFWSRMEEGLVTPELPRIVPEPTLTVEDERLDRIAAGFARIVDEKSPWTRNHSPGVAALADGIAVGLGFSADERRTLIRAALLHDLGKMGVSSLLLDRAGNLTEADRQALRGHPVLTRRVLSQAPGFADLAALGGAHHERLDGRGYPEGLRSSQLSPPMRALAVADVAEALVADRPYRPALPAEKALQVMRRDSGQGLCPECVEALETFLGRAPVPSQAGAT